MKFACGGTIPPAVGVGSGGIAIDAGGVQIVAGIPGYTQEVWAVHTGSGCGGDVAIAVGISGHGLLKGSPADTGELVVMIKLVEFDL